MSFLYSLSHFVHISIHVMWCWSYYFSLHISETILVKFRGFSVKCFNPRYLPYWTRSINYQPTNHHNSYMPFTHVIWSVCSCIVLLLLRSLKTQYIRLPQHIVLPAPNILCIRMVNMILFRFVLVSCIYFSTKVINYLKYQLSIFILLGYAIQIYITSLPC